MIIIKKMRKWLLEPKSKNDIDAHLCLAVSGLIVLSLTARIWVEVFAIEIPSRLDTIIHLILGLASIYALFIVVFYTLNFVVRIIVNLVANIYNHFKKK